MEFYLLTFSVMGVEPRTSHAEQTGFTFSKIFLISKKYVYEYFCLHIHVLCVFQRATDTSDPLELELQT